MSLHSYKRLPNHIAVIPDGNRRWATDKSLKKSDGYSFGLDCGMRLFEQCLKLGIPELTLYGFTNDNMKRPAEETMTTGPTLKKNIWTPPCVGMTRKT